MPENYTCAGDDISPPLVWVDIPAGTVEMTFVSIRYAAVAAAEPPPFRRVGRVEAERLHQQVRFHAGATANRT